MTHHTTIKIEITAFDDRATATYRVHATSKDNPAASVAALVSLMERYGWVEEKLDVPAFAPTAPIDCIDVETRLRAEILRVQAVTERAERAEARAAAAEAEADKLAREALARWHSSVAREPATYREQMATVSGLDHCELDVSESEAPRPSASPDLDIDRAAAHIVIEWAGVCTDVSALRAAIQREKAREHASPRKAVRASVIAACEARLTELQREESDRERLGDDVYERVQRRKSEREAGQ